MIVYWTAKVRKERLNPEAQRIIREIAVVNRIQGEVDQANAFDLRSLRLRLRLEMEAP